jgi:hypothetical protein
MSERISFEFLLICIHFLVRAQLYLKTAYKYYYNNPSKEGTNGSLTITSFKILTQGNDKTSIMGDKD